MEFTSPLSQRKFPHCFVCTLFSVLAFSFAIPAGIWTADLIAAHSGLAFTVQTADPYAGCDLAVEYAVRFSRLCLPTLLQLLVVWGAAYVRFEKPLLAFFFAGRGLVFGMALRLCLFVSAEIPALLLTLMFAGISLLFLALVFHIRTDEGIRPFADSVTAMMIAGGAVCCVVLLASLCFFR